MFRKYKGIVGSCLACVLPVASCYQVQLTTQNDYEGLSRFGAVKNGRTTNQHPAYVVDLHFPRIDYTMPNFVCFWKDL